MLDTLDAAAVSRWCAAALNALRRHQREIDELNVYPVPDADTGTNLMLTLAAAHQALTDAPAPDDGTPLGRTLRTLAGGALFGARGNSGALLAQLFSGMADALATVSRADGRQFADALARAADAAYGAVATPVEGTLLTVARAAADGARRHDLDDLAGTVEAAASAAATALAGTPRQLPALATAGVVDAGGRGLVVVLDALVGVVTGATPQRRREPPPRDPRLLEVPRETGSTQYGYEVQYLLDATAQAVAALRAALAGIGDSLVVLDTGTRPRGGDGHAAAGVWNVHVHVNDVGAAIEAGIEAGRPHRIWVSRFADTIGVGSTVGDSGTVGENATPGPASGDQGSSHITAERAVVALAPGEGLAALFATEGAKVVPVLPEPGRPEPGELSAEVLVAAIRATPAREIALVPHDPDAHEVARVAAADARSEGYLVSVVPARSPVQTLAAMAVRDPGRRFDDDVIAMADAAGACRYAELSVAHRDALTVAGRCRAGDALALVEGEVVVVGPDLVVTARELLDRMLGGGGELVTVVFGADAPDSLRRALPEHLSARWPFVELRVYDGGQRDQLLLVGVE